MHEGIPILNYLVPKAFLHDGRQAHRRDLREGRAPCATTRAAASWSRPASPTQSSNATTCWSRSARRTPSPGSSATSASTSTNGACRCSTRSRCSRRLPRVFFGGDAAFGPKNIIWAVAHGHDAAISIDQLLHGEDVRRAPAAGRQPDVAEDGHPRVELRQRRHARRALQGALARRQAGAAQASRSRSSSASTPQTAFKEAQRCLNCDVQTVFADQPCIECDACVDICPMDCITFTANGEEADLRTRLTRAGAQPRPGPLRLRRR